MSFIFFGAFWARGALGNMVTSIVSISHFGKRPVAREIAIFGSHVGREAIAEVWARNPQVQSFEGAAPKMQGVGGAQPHKVQRSGERSPPGCAGARGQRSGYMQGVREATLPEVA